MSRHYYATRHGGREEIYYVERLWKLAESLPVREVPIDSLDIDKPVWFHGQCPPLTEVVEHFEKVLSADLDYPLIVSAAGKVMDGFHRLVKARLEGRRTIRIVRFEVDPEPDEVNSVPHRRRRARTAEPSSNGHPKGYLHERLERLRRDLEAETERLRAIVAARVSPVDADLLAGALNCACDAAIAELAIVPHAVADSEAPREAALAAAALIRRIRESIAVDDRFTLLETAESELQFQPAHRAILLAAADELLAVVEMLAR
jgi:hypothetical protein